MNALTSETKERAMYAFHFNNMHIHIIKMADDDDDDALTLSEYQKRAHAY